MAENHKIAVIIVAAGIGSRAQDKVNGGKEDLPKQYQMLCGKPVILHALDVFLAHQYIDEITLVYHQDYYDLLTDILKHYGDKYNEISLVQGGNSRQESVKNGLVSLNDDAFPPDFVLIHDAARPLITDALINHLLASLFAKGASLPILPVDHALKRIHDDNCIKENLSRENMVLAQTPQGFPFHALLKAHNSYIGDGADDDVSIYMQNGGEVHVIDGLRGMIKITFPQDFAYIERLIKGEGLDEKKRNGMIRIGHGYDIHRLIMDEKATRKLMLCGVEIPFAGYLKGHSDADIGLHALTDALLGAMALGDIGTFFPDNETKWQGADSAIFLTYALDELLRRGGMIYNIDITIIAEQPKIGPYRKAMIERLGDLLKLSPQNISIKAKTNEGLDAIGRGEAMVAHASLIIKLPI